MPLCEASRVMLRVQVRRVSRGSSAVRTVSAASGAGMGTWQTSGYGASSLGLSAPTTVKALQTNEVYRLDLVWSLNSGP